MYKLMILGVSLLLVTTCRPKKAEVIAEDSTFMEISTEKWPKKTTINPMAKDAVKDWPEFNALDLSFDALYNVANREDLALVIEDLIEKQKTLEVATYPEIFDKAQIKSRQKVFKTFILKVKGNLEYRLEMETPTLEMIDAYNALRNQFNVIVNNSLDTKLILDE